MTSIISVPSKHLQALCNVKVSNMSTAFPGVEGQLAAAASAATARGDHNEQSVREGFEFVFKKPQGQLPALSWVILMNHSHRVL